MEHRRKDAKLAHRKNAGPIPAREPSSLEGSTHPLLELQQEAGNQAVHQLLRSRFLQAKLAISNPSDPEEREADSLAEQITRAPANSSAGTPCPCVMSGGELCDECKQKQAKIYRQAATPGTPQQLSGILCNVLRSAGRPIEPKTLGFFERRFGTDLSRVRIHTGSQADDSARAINARAFTAGDHIVFDQGQYRPDIPDGRFLLAHELAHVVRHPNAPGSIRRKYDDPYTYDPANPAAWSYLGTRDLRSAFWQKPLLATLSAAPEAALETENSLKAAQPPKTDEEKAQSVTQIRTLIRLNALGLMASNRAGVERKRDELLNQPKNRGATGGKGVEGGITANANAIRSAAAQAVRLNKLKEELVDSERNLRLESTSPLRVGGHTFSEAFEEILNQTTKYRSEEIRSYFASLSRALDGQKSLDRGTATALIFNMGRYLADWRHKQIGGVMIALNQIYESFPFLTQLAPEDVPQAGEATDEQLMAKVRTAFADLLAKIDNAITKIGAGDIDSFQLREAVKETRISLSPEQNKILDEAMEHQQVVEFWKDMALTFAQVLIVFIPVVGPALAAAIGAGQVLASVDDLLTRYQVASASTTPEGEVLGVSGPGAFEWAMLGVQAALTVADLGAAWKEINAARPRFHEAEPKLLEDEANVKPHDEELGVAKEGQEGELSAGKQQLDKEASSLKQRISEPENVRDVLDPELAKDYDFQVSVEEHTYYHRRDGTGWCRASGTAICGYSFGSEVEEALQKIRQTRRPSASGKPTEQFVADFLGTNFQKQVGTFEGKSVKAPAKYGMSIADFAGKQGSRRIVVEVKNIDIAANMRTGFVDLRTQTAGYLSNVPHPDSTKFWLFLDLRGQPLPPGGFKAIVESVSTGTGHVFDNIHLITESGVVVY